MNKTSYLFNTMVELHNYCNSTSFDAKLFAQKSKNFYDIYRRCSVSEQGEYHHLWHEYLIKEA